MTAQDPELMELGGTTVARDASAVIRLEFARLPTGTVIDTRVHVFRGPEPGPTLLLQGGLHGDEVGGIEILRRMLSRGLLQPQRGTVIAVPILNVFGFINFSRDVPDGKDVNRSFPGNRRGSLASRVAWHYMKEVFHHADVAIDFHTGGARRENYPQVRYTVGDEDSHALARAFAAPFLLPSKPIPKSFRRAALQRGVPVVVYEAGESLRFDDFAVEQGILGALRVMESLHMLRPDDARKGSEPVELAKSRWIRAARAGLFSACVPNGAPVHAGEVVGILARVQGGSEREIRAKQDGWIICVNKLPVVNQGDALLHVGTR